MNYDTCSFLLSPCIATFYLRGAGPRVVRLPTLEHNMVLCFSYVSLHSNEVDLMRRVEEL
jgi:hypothetical protein